MKEIIEVLDFEEDKPKVGRPRLATKKTKKKSLIVATFSFVAVTILLIFGYGTLFGFRFVNLRGTALGKEDVSTKKVLIKKIDSIFKDVTIKKGETRKLYVTINPAGATNKELSYKSLDSDIALVSKDGKVTGIKEGETKVEVTSMDGSNKKTSFNITVVKNAEGICNFSSLSRNNSSINYQIDCNNAKIKNVYYKVENGDYSKLLTNKPIDSVPLSKKQINKNITFKVVYYANNSNVSKYSVKTINEVTKKTTTYLSGYCDLNILSATPNSAKYDVSCNNASITNIAYKIGNGSYVGLDKSNIADTVIFEESDITRVIYFKVDYKIDNTNKVYSITKNGVIQKSNTITTTSAQSN